MARANELREAARKVRSLPNQMVRAGTAALKDPVMQSYKRDTGGDFKLSGLPNSGLLKPSTSVRGDAIAKGRVFMGGRIAGPASWLNNGTRPRRQGSGFHPGTRGRGTFERPVAAHLADAAREMERLFDQALN